MVDEGSGVHSRIPGTRRECNLGFFPSLLTLFVYIATYGLRVQVSRFWTHCGAGL